MLGSAGRSSTWGDIPGNVLHAPLVPAVRGAGIRGAVVLGVLTGKYPGAKHEHGFGRRQSVLAGLTRTLVMGSHARLGQAW